MSNPKIAEFVRGILHERTKFRGLDSNVSMVAAESEVSGVTAEAVRSAPVSTGAKVRAAIEKISDRLGINPEYAEGRRQFWEAHPELVRVIACDNFLDERCDEEGDASYDTLQYIFNQPGNREFFPVNEKYQAEQRASAREVEEAEYLRSLMRGWFETGQKFQYKNAHPSLWPKALAKEKSRLDSMDLTQLRNEVAERREKVRLASLSKEELRAEVRKPVTQHGQQLYADRFPTLPPEIYLRGSFQKVVLNRENLIRIANTDVEWFKQLCGKYGDAAINQRMQEGI